MTSNNGEILPKKIKLNSNEEEEEEDRLSSLPDPILVDILSLLPFESAVITGILSKRWCRLWNQLTSLRIHSETLLFGCHWKFYSVIDHILGQLTSSRIDAFNFHFPTPPVDAHYLFTFLLRHICDRFAKQIEVTFTDYGNLTRVLLPSFVLESDSLRVLVLGFGFDYKLPDNGVYLPNLNLLEIYVYEEHLEFLAKLVQSCPVLQHLTVWVNSREYQDDSIQITSASLKSLRMILIHNLELTKVAIDAPKLEFFSLRSSILARCCFAKMPKGLLNVEVWAGFDYDASSKGRLEWDFVKSIANAKSLVLQQRICPAFCYMNDFELPVYDGLTTLELALHFPTYWKGLMRFLEYCPNLLVLRLRREKFDWHGTSWIKLDSVPTCLSTTVKSMIFKCFHGVEQELELLRYLLMVATVLENLHVTIAAPPAPHVPDTEKQRRLQLRKESDFCQKLYTFPRSSDMCRIKVAGQCLPQ